MYTRIYIAYYCQVIAPHCGRKEGGREGGGIAYADWALLFMNNKNEELMRVDAPRMYRWLWSLVPLVERQEVDRDKR